MSSTIAAPSLVTSSTGPVQPTGSPAGSNTNSTWPPASPDDRPIYVAESDGAVYINTTIDDFSPLVTFSNLSTDWVTPLTDSDLSAVRPERPRTWNLGTYRRTEEKNATVTIEFWGSEIHLYGDTGPAYGAYSLSVDGSDPTIHSALASDRGRGPAHLLHTLRDLSEGRHELVITALGTREGLTEGPSFLFDYAVAKQRVAETGGVGTLQTTELRGEALTRLTTNGTWNLQKVQDDLQPGEGGVRPAIYFERDGFATTQNWATLTHSFRGSGVQVYGGRNASHGSYLVSLSNAGTSTEVHSRVYNATADCDEPEPGSTVPGCEWRGSVLKFAAADLDPDLEYELRLQNIANENKSAFEVNLIRVIGPSGLNPPVDGESVFVNGTSAPSSPSAEDDETDAGITTSPNMILNLLTMVIFLRILLVSLRR